jgi:hypothetical protein
MAIVGDKIAPGLLDHYLARWGYESQQTDKPADLNQSNDLWEALPGDYGAHGKFDRISRKSSLQLWLNLNRSWLALAGTLAGSALAFALVRRNWRI